LIVICNANQTSKDGKCLENCKSAEPGFYLTNNSCEPCPAGYYCEGGIKDRVICPKNSYCPAKSTKPTPCPDSKITDGEGAKSVDECKVVPQSNINVTTVSKTSGTLPVTNSKLVTTGGIATFVFAFSLFANVGILYFFFKSKKQKSSISQNWLKVSK
jgi:hypothetical protein